MDWNAAIERHRDALKRVLATLAALAGFTSPHPELVEGSAIGSRQSDLEHADDISSDCLLPTTDCPHPEVRAAGEPRRTLPRHLHRAVLRLLRPAEAAARRLVIVAARGIETPPVSSPHRVRGGEVPRAPRRSGGKQIALPLFDPLRRSPDQRCLLASQTAMPRISIPGWSVPAPLPVPPSPDDPVDATRLTLRLAALARVLDDLPREARRFARWKSGRDAAGAQNEKARDAAGVQNEEITSEPSAQDRKAMRRRIWPLRLGPPPGPPSGRRPFHTVHQILEDVHGLAFWALESPDTS